MITYITGKNLNTPKLNSKNNFTGIPLIKGNSPVKKRDDLHYFNVALLKNYYLPFTSNKPDISTTKEAETYVKEKFGINADFGDNLKAANLFIKALDKVKQHSFAGLNVITDYSVFKNRPKLVEKNGNIREIEPFLTMTGSETAIYINPKFDWDNIEQRVSKNFDKGNLAYKNPVGLALHEIGHFLHYESNSGKYKAANDEIPEGNQRKIIINEISKRAANDYGEFVAEVFAKKMLKENISPEIQESYKDWAYYGPTIF